MGYRSGVLTGLILALVLVAGAAGGWWLLNSKGAEAKKSAPPPIPASVPKPLKEDQITSLTLTADAEQRLALSTATIERKSMRRSRTYGGEVMIPVGHTLIVSSPLSGMLRATSSGSPVPGQTVKAGQPMFELLPLLTPEGRANLATSKVDADGLVQNAQTQLDAATIALNRAMQLLKDEAGSKRQVDEAQAQVDLAKKALEAATARRDLLVKVIGDVDRGTASAIVIEAPTTGMLRNLSVRAGQTIPSGAAMFEVFDPSHMWVRVPVYVGDLKDLDTSAPANIAALTTAPGVAGQSAKPVVAPPSANALAGTVDLFYELDNRTTKYSPAHRVGVTIPQNDSADSLTIPWSAIVHDIHGGSWVYEKTGAHTFVRRRVQVRFVNGNTAVLINGPAVGTNIVTAGAAELFGTETGFSK
ncbi:MAG: efflux RND transporter periplasmic adaptor subunit [Gemmatales bacterium]